MWTVYKRIPHETHSYITKEYKPVAGFKSYTHAIDIVDALNEEANDWHLYQCSQHDLTQFNKELIT